MRRNHGVKGILMTYGRVKIRLQRNGLRNAGRSDEELLYTSFQGSAWERRQEALPLNYTGGGASNTVFLVSGKEQVV